MNSQNVQFTERRLGKQIEGKIRPILVTLYQGTDRRVILNHTKNLKSAGEDFKSIYVKKDTHPAIRREWKRLFDAKEEEEKKPENVGVTIMVDTRKRQLLRNDVVIDRWRPSFFV